MDFDELEKRFYELKGKLTSGVISEEEFKAEIEKLRLEDSEGRLWMIGAQTGKWYYYDGSKWVPGQPPGVAAEKAAAPTCPQCGEPVEEGAIFCGNCGLRLAPPPPPEAPPPREKPLITAPPPPAPPPPPRRGLPRCLIFGGVGLVAVIALAICLGAGGYLYFTRGRAARVPTPFILALSPTPPMIIPTPGLTAADYLALADELASQNKFTEATANYQQVIALEPNNALAYAGWARALNFQGYLEWRPDLHEEAVAKALVATQLDPHNAEAFARLTRAYDWDEQYDKAVAAGQKAIELNPNYAEAHALLAEAYVDTDNMVQAEVEVQQALQLDPDNAEAHRTMGFIYFLREEDEAAAAEFEMAMKSEPNLALRHYELASQYRGLGDYNLAITGYKRAIALYPQAAVAYGGLGLTYQDQERYAEAIPYYQQAIVINDEYVDSHWRLGQCYTALEEWEQAIAAYQQVVALEPEADNAYANMAWAYYELGEYSAATTAAQKALELNPENEVAQEVLAGLEVAVTTPPATSTPIVMVVTPTPKPGTPTPTPTPKPIATPTPQLTGKIAFTVFDLTYKRYTVYSVNADGSGRRLVAEQVRQPSFRPDGKEIVAKGDRQPEERLVLMNSDGSGGRVVPFSAVEDMHPNFSPEGDRLLFGSTRHGDRAPRIYVMALGAEPRPLNYGAADVLGRYPSWLPDGRIVFNSCDYWATTTKCGLYIINASGGIPTRITTGADDTAPTAHGDKIAFMCFKNANWEVCSVSVAGGETKNLTNNPAKDGLPAWSPDGGHIAFVTDRSGQWELWVMNADGSGQRKLLALDGGYGTGLWDWTLERVTWAP